jgi:hypothetical protein
MVKQGVESDMSVEVFVQKDICAKKIQDLVSFSLPERWGHLSGNSCVIIITDKARAYGGGR